MIISVFELHLSSFPVRLTISLALISKLSWSSVYKQCIQMHTKTLCELVRLMHPTLIKKHPVWLLDRRRPLFPIPRECDFAFHAVPSDLPALKSYVWTMFDSFSAHTRRNSSIDRRSEGGWCQFQFSCREEWKRSKVSVWLICQGYVTPLFHFTRTWLKKKKIISMTGNRVG